MPGSSRDPSNEGCVMPFPADRENGVKLGTDQREDDVDRLPPPETSTEWSFPLELVDHVRHHAHAQGFVVPVEPGDRWIAASGRLRDERQRCGATKDFAVSGHEACERGVR